MEKCPCGKEISKSDKENVGLCVSCYLYEIECNWNSNLKGVRR